MSNQTPLPFFFLNFWRGSVVAWVCAFGVSSAGGPAGLAQAATDASKPGDVATTSDSADQSVAAEHAQVIERLRAAIELEVKAKDLPAFSLALVSGDQTIWAGGFGFQDAERKIPADKNTIYRVGSVSKLFTDIAIMQLVEQQRLDLDAPVTSYLPSFQPKNVYDTPITLRQLMSHHSGLVREPPVGHYFDPDEPSLDATVASLNQTALVYPPQTRTKYSNAGIAVVGSVLEKQRQLPFARCIDETILRPLGMGNSGFELTPQQRKRLATAWMWTYDGRRFEAPTWPLGTAPAGNLYASVADLTKFLVAVFHQGNTPRGQILTPQTLDQMLTPQISADGQPTNFGIGFHLDQLDGHTKIGHGGAVYGFSTQLEALPERKLGVAAVASLDGSNGVVGRLAEFALRLMLASQDGKPLPTYRSTTLVPAERANELVGEYQNGHRLARIWRDGQRLWMQRGSIQHELRAASDDGAIITDDAIGFGTRASLDRDGHLVVGTETYERLADEPPADIPDGWDGLIGEYGWDHNTLYILENRGRLVALIEWFYAYPLTQVDENVFEFPDYGLYHGEALHFTRDASGRATGVVAAEVVFDRREVGTRDGETFQIEPVRPIDELRAGALAATPPPEPGEFRDADLVQLTTLAPTIKLDIRYATTNNFTGAQFYQQPRAFLQRPAADAVVRAHQRLKERGLGLLIHDAYRPWHVTKMFWDATPAELKDFVANPANGSRHNRGCAIDLTLYDLKTGEAIPMVAGYDEFSPRSFPNYPGGTSRQRWYRQLLRSTMEAEGFAIYEFEWWHFDYQDWKQYRIGNVTFEDILER